MLVCLLFLDNHDYFFFVICCCMLKIVFISWQTVVCLLNSTALSPGEGEIPHWADPRDERDL